MTDSPGRVPCVEIESVGQIHGEPCLRFRPLILAFSSRIVLQTLDGSSVLQEAISYDIPLQRVLIQLPFRLGRQVLLAIQENRGSLDAQ